MVNTENISSFYPEFKNITHRIVVLTTWNIDGSTSEMRFVYPCFCYNGDDSGSAAAHLMEWVQEMTRYHLKISAYQLVEGVIYQDGTERIGTVDYGKYEIPVGKIYKTGRMGGKWKTPEQIEKDKNRQKQRYYEGNMSKGYQATTGKRNPHKPRVGSKIYLN